jgi:hypothetical protein
MRSYGVQAAARLHVNTGYNTFHMCTFVSCKDTLLLASCTSPIMLIYKSKNSCIYVRVQYCLYMSCMYYLYIWLSTTCRQFWLCSRCARCGLTSGFGLRRAASGVQAAMEEHDGSANEQCVETAHGLRAACNRCCRVANGFEPVIMSRADHYIMSDELACGRIGWGDECVTQRQSKFE